MSSIDIVLDEGRTTFRPLDPVAGRVRWTFDDASAEKLTLELLWHTEGKGSRDAQVVASMDVENPGPRGERTFGFTLPAGPYSFSGKLLSIVWKLQASVDSTGDEQQATIVVSPNGSEIHVAPGS